MPHVFISYSHKDGKIAKLLAEELRQVYGHDQIWFDENLTGGDNWRNRLLQKITQCDIFLFLVSADSLNSRACQRELDQAQGSFRPIIPILVSKMGFDEIPFEISQLQIIDMSLGHSTPRLRNLQAAIQIQIDLANEQEETTPDSNSSSLPTLSPSQSSSSGSNQQNVASASGGGVVRQTNISVGSSGRIILVVTLIIVAIVAIILLLLARSFQSPAPTPSLAYEFLVDTSENMLVPLNGIPRYRIVTDAVQKIADVPGFGTKQVWRGLRLVGGGTTCNQTSLAVQGRDLPINNFMAPLNAAQFGGTNAYELGIRGTFEDLALEEPANSDIQVVLIFLGSLDLQPCKSFDIPSALSAYKQLGIKTTFCAFTLASDTSGFEKFRKQMVDLGFGCVYNEKTSEEISEIAVRIIQNEINRVKEIEIELTAALSPTPIVLLASATSIPTTLPTTDILVPNPTPTTLQVLSPMPSNTSEPTKESTEITNIEPVKTNASAATSAPCTIQTDRERYVVVHVGPGVNRSAVMHLPANQLFVVLGQTAANDGSMWWKLDKETVAPNSGASEVWIAQADVENIGDCSQVTNVLAPTLIPVSLPQTSTLSVEPVCYPDEWLGECGSNSCDGIHQPKCNSDGTGIVCVSNSGACSPGTCGDGICSETERKENWCTTDCG